MFGLWKNNVKICPQSGFVYDHFTVNYTLANHMEPALFHVAV